MDNHKWTEQELEELKHELEEFRKEKERIRMIVGQIGGVPSFNSKITNIVFFSIVVASLILSVFVQDIWRYILIDIAVAVLSLKIIYLIHTLTRENHFELWILTSLEWQINDIRQAIRRLQELHKDVKNDK